jgi:hypothetical protein
MAGRSVAVSRIHLVLEERLHPGMEKIRGEEKYTLTREELID